LYKHSVRVVLKARALIAEAGLAGALERTGLSRASLETAAADRTTRAGHIYEVSLALDAGTPILPDGYHGRARCEDEPTGEQIRAWIRGQRTPSTAADVGIDDINKVWESLPVDAEVLGRVYAAVQGKAKSV
jgi:hypothetical protein